MCTIAWSDEIDWLQSLVININHETAVEIGILCPDNSTMDQIRSRPNYNQLSVRVGTSDDWPEALFDYLIIYKAHSIGPAEAMKPLMTIEEDRCVVLVGDPKMPNLRVRSPLVRAVCGSILQWFYNKSKSRVFYRGKRVYDSSSGMLRIQSGNFLHFQLDVL